MSATVVPEAGPLIRDLIAKLFEGHGIATEIDGDVIRFPAHPNRRVSGTLFKHAGYHPSLAQLDVLLALNDTEVICESVTGVGDTLEGQVLDGVRAVASTSLHVLMSAFFGTEPCHGTDVYRLRINGQERVIHLGPVTSRMGVPETPTGEADVSFFPVFERHLSNYPLPGGTHWVRVYLSRVKGLPPTTEVLIDNASVPELEMAMAPLYTPPPADQMDVRVFLVVQVAPTV